MDNKVLRGYVTRILSLNDSGWGIAIFTSEENSKAQIKIKGSISTMQTKVLYEINGKFEEHARYGTSFAIQGFKQGEINSKEQVVKYLSSPLFPGVGEKKAQLIIDYYGDQAITKMKNEPDSLYEIKGLEPKVARVIIDSLKKIEDEERLTSIFFEYTLKIDILTQVKKYSESDEEAEQIFKNNFFNFAMKKKIQPFFEVDRVAVHFGLPKISPERIAFWAAKVALDIAMSTGDTYTNKNNLTRQLIKAIGIDDLDLIHEGFLYAKNHNLLFFKEGRIYVAEAWLDEQIIAEELNKLKNANVKQHKDDELDKIIDQIEHEIAKENKLKNFHYDQVQRDALKTFAQSNFLILTGGPGTGKTTVIKGMSKLFTHLYNSTNIGVAAPTGRAAARINEFWTKLSATTIHKMLKADANDNYEITPNNPLTFDLIILDEASMIENHLFAKFISSIGYAKKVVLVGDANQLPSVGYGNMFEDLIDTNQFSTIKLQNNYRQADGNGIINLAYAIQTNTLDQINFEQLKNVKSFFDFDNENALGLLKQDFAHNLELINQNSFNYQIISPIYAGTLGIENINTEIQVEFNTNILDKDKLYDCGRYRYTVGDKVMFLKNDRELDLTNGEVGIIENIKLKNNRLDYAEVNFGDNKVITLLSSNFDSIALAYACSVHKTQGSEYKHVVFALEDNGKSSFFLNKKLIYTAITRAKDELVLIGDKQLFLRAATREAIRRKTTLIDKILSHND